jgi:hypothetical protein
VIEQAKGALAERASVNVGEAFQMLPRHTRSQDRCSTTSHRP